MIRAMIGGKWWWLQRAPHRSCPHCSSRGYLARHTGDPDWCGCVGEVKNDKRQVVKTAPIMQRGKK